MHNLHKSINQEVDMYLGGEFTLDKAAFVDVSVPLYYDDVEIMIPFPKKRDNSRALYEIYSPTVIFRLTCP